MIATGLRSLCRVLTPCLFLFIGTAAEVARPKPVIPHGRGVANAAEEVRLLVGGPIILSVSVDSLATFAETGEVAEDMQLFTRFANEEAITGFRQALQANIPLTVQQVDNLGYSNLGQDILFNVGKVIRPHPSLNGDRALRGAVIKAAAIAREDNRPAEWTALDVLKAYPSQTIDLRLQDLQEIRRFVTSYINKRNRAIAAIQAQAKVETSQETNPIALTEDLSVSGPYAFELGTMTLSREVERQTPQGVQPRYSFDVDTFIPQGLSAPAPVIIVSHGYNDSKENFYYIGRHLASHGFVVLLPEHIGSDLKFRLSYTEGRINTAINPSEYISRPEEISYIIDQLEANVKDSPIWANRVDLSKIGLLGHSFGASTAYAIAGANINFERLVDRCESASIDFNPALYIQCQARFLPNQRPDQLRELQDPRIKVVISANGIASALYSPEDLGNIEIPLLMASAVNDVVAPSLLEQIRPFAWIGSEKKYLAIMSDASHFSFTSGEDTEIASPITQPGAEALEDFVVGGYRDIGSAYFEALNLAFWNVELKGEAKYLPYLSNRYAQQLSANQIPTLTVVRDISPEITNGEIAVK